MTCMLLFKDIYSWTIYYSIVYFRFFSNLIDTYLGTKSLYGRGQCNVLPVNKSYLTQSDQLEYPNCMLLAKYVAFVLKLMLYNMFIWVIGPFRSAISPYEMYREMSDDNQLIFTSRARICYKSWVSTIKYIDANVISQLTYTYQLICPWKCLFYNVQLAQICICLPFWIFEMFCYSEFIVESLCLWRQGACCLSDVIVFGCPL